MAARPRLAKIKPAASISTPSRVRIFVEKSTAEARRQKTAAAMPQSVDASRQQLHNRSAPEGGDQTEQPQHYPTQKLPRTRSCTEQHRRHEAEKQHGGTPKCRAPARCGQKIILRPRDGFGQPECTRIADVYEAPTINMMAMAASTSPIVMTMNFLVD